jgi:hypothetical protein
VCFSRYIRHFVVLAVLKRYEAKQTTENKAAALFKGSLNVFTKTEREFLMKCTQLTFWCTPTVRTASL